MRNHPFANNEVTQLRSEIRALRQILHQLENAQVTTVPVYNEAGLLTGDAVEGQMVIDSITTPGTPIFKFYQNGSWHEP